MNFLDFLKKNQDFQNFFIEFPYFTLNLLELLRFGI